MAEKRTRKPKGKKEPLSDGERRRLRQLVVCVLLFGVVFVGRGVDLGPLSRVSSTVSELVRSDTDFQAVFARMGESFSQGEAVETFRALWGSVFSDKEGSPAGDPAREESQETGQADTGGENGASQGT